MHGVNTLRTTLSLTVGTIRWPSAGHLMVDHIADLRGISIILLNMGLLSQIGHFTYS